MSTHRVCCACCLEGDWVYPQPCQGSTAWDDYDEEKDLNTTHWDEGCLPRFDCQYIKDKLAEQSSGKIAFAFLGACWFFNGKEPIHQWCDPANDECEQPLGFDLTGVSGGGPLNGDRYWEVEEVYTDGGAAWIDPCAECFNDIDSHGDYVNERWFRFNVCECEQDFPDEPPPSDGPGGQIPPGDRPPPPTGGGVDYCTFAFEENPVYIPARYLPKLMETDCCIVGTGTAGIPCITPEGCDEPRNKCHFWKEPISTILEPDGRPKCCLKSCTEENTPDIVNHIPYCDDITPDLPVGEWCQCLNIWTPYHLHPLIGGEVDGHDNETPYSFDRETSLQCNPTGYEDDCKYGARQRGCCTCCCGPPCNSMMSTWDFCRGFEGMSTFTITIEINDVDNLGGALPGGDATDWEYCHPWIQNFWHCPFGTQILSYEFDVYPEVPDCIRDCQGGGGSEANCYDACVPFDETNNVTDCILLSNNEPDCCVIWEDGELVNQTEGTNNIGACNEDGHLTCYSAQQANQAGVWKQKKFYSTGSPTFCEECINAWYPASGDCEWHESSEGGVCWFEGTWWCPHCCSSHDNTPPGSEEECTDQDYPSDVPPGDWDGTGECNITLGEPCCGDVEGCCQNQPYYVTKDCDRSPGGTWGYWLSSYGLRWGHYDFCQNPSSGQIVGFRIGFTHGSFRSGVPGVRSPDSNTEHYCCTNGGIGQDPPYGCHDSCCFTACSGAIGRGWSCGWTPEGGFNCPYLFCFIMPDDRIDGEGECIPYGQGAVAEGAHGSEPHPPLTPADGIHPDGLEKPASFPMHDPPSPARVPTEEQNSGIELRHKPYRS